MVTFLLEKVKQSISWNSFQKSVFIVVELCYEFQRTRATCIGALSSSLRYNEVTVSQIKSNETKNVQNITILMTSYVTQLIVLKTTQSTNPTFLHSKGVNEEKEGASSKIVMGSLRFQGK